MPNSVSPDPQVTPRPSLPQQTTPQATSPPAATAQLAGMVPFVEPDDSDLGYLDDVDFASALSFPASDPPALFQTDAELTPGADDAAPRLSRR